MRRNVKSTLRCIHLTEVISREPETFSYDVLTWRFGCGVQQGAQLKKHIDATLGSGNLREAVRLPPGEDLYEWLAVNSNSLIPSHYSTILPPIFVFHCRINLLKQIAYQVF